MQLGDLKGKRVGICVSGGLDSKTVTSRLIEAGADVLCFTADLGQPDEGDINDIPRRMAATGATTHVVDLKLPMAQAALMLVRAQGTYDGGYWNTTGLARAVTVRGLLPRMRELGCDVLAHGATGRGNDQLRFERYTNVLEPKMQVYAPWRDPMLLEQFPGRKQMAAYLQARGIEADVGGKKRYSTDANLAGLSHEAEDLEELTTGARIVSPIMGVWPVDAPDTIESVEVRVEAGQCVGLNGAHKGPLAMMLEANQLAGRNGIWMRNALENRVIGTKSRGVYEAPGMELLGHAVRCVYQASMDRRASAHFAQLSRVVADAIYDGRAFDPVVQAAIAGIDALTRHATGTVRLGLHKGNIYFESLTALGSSLYNAADSSMEESDGLNPNSSQGYVEVQSVEARALARAGQINADVLR